MKFNPKNHKALIILILLMTILVAGIILFLNFTRNYAEEVAQPMEKALIDAGAIKKQVVGMGATVGIMPNPTTMLLLRFPATKIVRLNS